MSTAKLELHIGNPDSVNDAFMDAYNALVEERRQCITGNYTLLPDTLYEKLMKKFGKPSHEWEEYIDAQLFIIAGVCQQLEKQINGQDQSN